MKKAQIFISVIVVLAIVFSVESCAKKGCTYPNATNYDASAKEDDGTCKFTTTGNTDIAGQWLVKDTAEFYPITTGYTITITKSPSVDTQLIIFNLAELGHNVNATLSGSTFSIPKQTYSVVGGSATYTGSGVIINSNTIRLLYNLDSYQFSGTATKQ